MSHKRDMPGGCLIKLKCLMLESVFCNAISLAHSGEHILLACLQLQSVPTGVPIKGFPVAGGRE